MQFVLFSYLIVSQLMNWWISCWSLVIGHWSLVIGHWLFVIGHWSLVIGHWLLVRLIALLTIGDVQDMLVLIFEQSSTANIMFKNTKLVGFFSLTACVFSVGIVAPVLSQSQEYPTQVSTDASVTWELKSCAKKPNNVVSCIVSVSRSEDGPYGIFVQNSTKLVDAEGNEYYPIKAQILKRVVGAGSLLDLNMAKDSQYKVTIDFGDVPISVPYATLLQIAANHTISGGAKFRNVPFINLDGSIPAVPRSNRPPVNNQPVNTNNPTPRRKTCLPFVGCL